MFFRRASKGESARGVREMASLPPREGSDVTNIIQQETERVRRMIASNEDVSRQFVVNDLLVSGENWVFIEPREQQDEARCLEENPVCPKNATANECPDLGKPGCSKDYIQSVFVPETSNRSLSPRRTTVGKEEPTCSKYLLEPNFVPEDFREPTQSLHNSSHFTAKDALAIISAPNDIEEYRSLVDKMLMMPSVVMGRPCPQSGLNFDEVFDNSIGEQLPEKYFGLSNHEGVIVRFNVVEHRPRHTARRFTNGIDYPGRIRPMYVFGQEATEMKISIVKKISKCLRNRMKTLVQWARKLCAPPRIQALRGARGHPGKATTPDDAIRAYALHLAADKTTIFAQNVENFISCTKESKETCPHVVMRNMRQFMSGMKNYLVKHGEREFEKEVEKARLMLKPNEFLNLDAILEDVLYTAVVTPLRSHVYALLADKYVKSGDVAQLDAGMKICRALPPLRIGIKPYTRVPKDDEMVSISNSFLKMQEAESPSQKMEYLLAAISGIFQSMKADQLDTYCGPMNRNIGADDFLPYLVYCLARCSLPGAELEAELMAGLLPPRMLSGEGGYYLTTLFGAVAILKQLAPKDDNKNSEWHTGSIGSSMIPTPASTPCSSGGGVAKILVPDECSGALRCLSLPWRAGAKAKDICRVLAHRARITDAQDYGLFVLRDGEETLINDTDCPQDIIDQNKCNCMFAYKRVDAKIAWPKQALTSYP